MWELQDLTGNPLNEEMTELTSDATGDRSTAAKYFTAHLGRQFDNKVHNVEDTMTECLGKTVMLSISTKPSGYRKVDVFPAQS